MSQKRYQSKPVRRRVQPDESASDAEYAEKARMASLRTARQVRRAERFLAFLKECEV